MENLKSIGEYNYNGPRSNSGINQSVSWEVPMASIWSITLYKTIGLWGRWVPVVQRRFCSMVLIETSKGHQESIGSSMAETVPALSSEYKTTTLLLILCSCLYFFRYSKYSLMLPKTNASHLAETRLSIIPPPC